MVEVRETKSPVGMTEGYPSTSPGTCISKYSAIENSRSAPNPDPSFSNFPVVPAGLFHGTRQPRTASWAKVSRPSGTHFCDVVARRLFSPCFGGSRTKCLPGANSEQCTGVFCLLPRRKSVGKKAQGLKPRFLLGLNGPTKSCPDTKHQSGDSRKTRVFRRFKSIRPPRSSSLET